MRTWFVDSEFFADGRPRVIGAMRLGEPWSLRVWLGALGAHGARAFLRGRSLVAYQLEADLRVLGLDWDDVPGSFDLYLWLGRQWSALAQASLDELIAETLDWDLEALPIHGSQVRDDPRALAAVARNSVEALELLCRHIQGYGYVCWGGSRWPLPRLPIRFR